MGHIPPDGVSGQGMNRNGYKDDRTGNEEAVSQGMPEICYPHGFCKVIQTECGGKGQNSGDVIGHFGGAFKGYDNCHI